MTANPVILPSDTAPEGDVLTLPAYRASDFPPGSAVLCRNTAPLVAHAYGLLQRDVPCRILGKDIGAQLISIVRKMHAVDMDTFLTRLTAWFQREMARCAQEEKNPDRIEDQYACLRFFVDSLDEKSRSVSDLIAKIELLFSDDAPSASRVTLSTIHKAKGLEFSIVYFLDKHLIPSKYAKQPWQLQQERNLKYVAVTRAMEKLIYIASSCWKGDEA